MMSMTSGHVRSERGGAGLSGDLHKAREMELVGAWDGVTRSSDGAKSTWNKLESNPQDEVGPFGKNKTHGKDLVL